MSKECIQVGERWRIVRADERNWQLYEHRELGHAVRKGYKDRAGEFDWMPLQRFYSTPEGAATYIVDHCTAGDDVQTLDEFRQSRAKEVRRLAKAVKKVDA